MRKNACKGSETVKPHRVEVDDEVNRMLTLCDTNFFFIHIIFIFSFLLVLGVAESDSGVRIVQFKMADPIWRLY